MTVTIAQETLVEAQEIFDRVATHLATQGRRAVVPGSTYGFTGKDADHLYCVYRAPDGSRCALGALIPDEEYSPSMEKELATQVFREFESPTLAALRVHEKLILALQSAHDTKQNDDEVVGGFVGFGPIRPRLERVAEQHGLSPAILDTLTFPEVWQ